MLLLVGLGRWYEGPVGNSSGDIKESWLLGYLELLVGIFGPFLFRPGGFEFILDSCVTLDR